MKTLSAVEQWDSDRVSRWYRMGRTQGYDGLVPLAVPLSLRELPECADALLRGFLYGQDEREVDETMEAMRKIAWDDRPAPKRED